MCAAAYNLADNRENKVKLSGTCGGKYKHCVNVLCTLIYTVRLMYAGLIRLLNDSEYIKNHTVIENVCGVISNLADNNRENKVQLAGACEGKLTPVPKNDLLRSVIYIVYS